MDNQRLVKARQVYEHWNEGNGDEGELAIALYDLAADYEVLLSDFAQLEQRVEGLAEALMDIAEGNASVPNATLEEGRPALTSFMWTYSQKRAREALAEEEA